MNEGTSNETNKQTNDHSTFEINVLLSPGILGAALLYGLTPSQIHGDLGVTKPAVKINGAQAFGIELLLTFMLIFTIFAATDSGKEHRGYEIPLSIGLSVFVCHIVGVGVLK